MGSVVEETWDKFTLDQALLRVAQEDASALIEAFRADFTRRFAPQTDVVLGDSARALLLATFQALAVRGFGEIYLCHYNCPVVRDAARASGLPIRWYSVESLWHEDASVISDLAASLGEKTTAVLVVPHLFGRPSQVPQGLSDAQRDRLFIIEDCAHTLGGQIADLPVGTLFDAGVFSFNLDKPISLLGGGAIALASDAARNLGLMEKLTGDDRANIRRAMADWQRLRRVLRGSVMRRRFYQVALKLRLRQTPRTGFAFGPTRAALGLVAMAAYDQVRETRQANYQHILGDYATPMLPRKAVAAPLRLRVLITDETERTILQRRLKSAGILCGNLNWSVPLGENAPNHDCMWAHRGVDLPIDVFLRDEEVETIARSLQEADYRLP